MKKEKGRKDHRVKVIRKIAGCFALVLCMLCLFGCTTTDRQLQTGGEGTYLYYVSSDDTRIVPVSYSIPRVDASKLSEEKYYERVIYLWLDALSEFPPDVELKSPIEKELHVANYTLVSGQLTLDFDSFYYNKTSFTEVLRRAAIVKTLLQIDGVEGVSFTVEGEPITDSKHVPIGVMTEETFVSNPGAEINSYEMTSVVLYFADEDGDKLIETKENVGFISNISMERLIVDRVIAGPLTKKCYPTVSPTLKVINVTTKDGVCYINFDNTFLTKTQKVTDEAVIYSFVNSLTELPHVGKVQFMVDSETEVTFGDHLYLSDPFERNLDMIEPLQETEAR